MSIVERYKVIKNYMSDYERQFQRDCDSVELLAVSKGQTIEKIQCLYTVGQRSFAESYWQEANNKIQALHHLDICWHFIGRIQKNKIKDIAQNFAWVHGVDTLEQARYLDQQRALLGLKLNICLQVNVCKDAHKGGVAPEELLVLATQIRPFKYLKLRGLMTLPVVNDNFDQQREPFKRLVACYDQLIASGFKLDTLSMGMSNDYKAAIAEGATMVRIGKALFDEQETI